MSGYVFYFVNSVLIICVNHSQEYCDSCIANRECCDCWPYEEDYEVEYEDEYEDMPEHYYEDGFD